MYVTALADNDMEDAGEESGVTKQRAEARTYVAARVNAQNDKQQTTTTDNRQQK